MKAPQRSERTRILEIAAVAAFCLLAGLVHAIHWWGQRPLMCGDNAKHFITSYGMFAGMTSAADWVSGLKAALTPPTEYPPLPFLWTCALFSFWGFTQDVATLGQILWLEIMLVATYVFMRRHTGPAVALTATLLVATSPVVSGAALHYAPDLAMAATSFVALALLATDHRFENRTVSIWLGVAVAMSLLTKWSALLYLAAPFAVAGSLALAQASWAGRCRFLFLSALLAGVAVVLPPRVNYAAAEAQGWALVAGIPLALVSLRILRGDRERRLGNLFLALLVAWVLSSGVYAQLIPRLPSRLSLAVTEGVPMQQQLRVLSSVAVAGVFGLPLLAPVGLLALLLSRTPNPFRWLAFAFLAGLGLTFVAQVPHARYYAPLVPLGAVLCTFWVSALRPPARLSLTAVLLFAGIAQAALLVSPGGNHANHSPGWLRAYVNMYFTADSSETLDFPRPEVVRARMEVVLDRLKDVAPPGSIVSLLCDQGLAMVPASAWEALSMGPGRSMIVQELRVDGGTLHLAAKPWNIYDLARHPARSGGGNDKTGFPADVFLLVAQPSRHEALTQVIERDTGRRHQMEGAYGWSDGASVFILKFEGLTPRRSEAPPR